jgi:hypothetical protein
MGLELERDLELFFQKNWSKLSLTLFLCFLRCSFTSDAERTFIALQFGGAMTQKLLNLVKEWQKYWKMFDDKYMFSDATLRNDKNIDKCSMISICSVMGDFTLLFF